MKLWLGFAASALLASPLSCGARSDLSSVGSLDGARPEGGMDARPTRMTDSGRDAADVTVVRVDAGPPPGADGGADVSIDVIVVDVVVTVDATASDACPASYPGDDSTCSALGAVCNYPQGSCTCYAGCCGGPPITCAQLGVQCGPTMASCGTLLECGGCPAGETCGGGGALGQCGSAPDGFSCVARTCESPDQACGVIGDGCGSELNCPPCLTWGCTAAVPGCPALQPETGAACPVEAQSCTYSHWLHDCCYQVLTCVGGAWTSGGEACPS